MNAGGSNGYADRLVSAPSASAPARVAGRVGDRPSA